MFDIGRDQLKVLLLVLKPKHNPAQNIVLIPNPGRLISSALNGRIHMRPKRKNLIQRRPRERATQIFGRHVAKRNVIGVEEPVKVRMKRLITIHIRRQNERLKKPRGMRKMPLHRTRVRRRLHHQVLRRKRSGKPQGRRAHRAKAQPEGRQPAYPGFPVMFVWPWRDISPELFSRCNLSCRLPD